MKTQVKDQLNKNRCESHRWFIEHQYIGIHHQTPGEGEHLLPPPPDKVPPNSSIRSFNRGKREKPYSIRSSISIESVIAKAPISKFSFTVKVGKIPRPSSICRSGCNPAQTDVGILRPGVTCRIIILTLVNKKSICKVQNQRRKSPTHHIGQHRYNLRKHHNYCQTG